MTRVARRSGRIRAKHRLEVRPDVPDLQRISATIQAPDGTAMTVATESSHPLDSSATPWLAPTIPTAMWLSADLTIEGAVDPVALENAGKAQRVLAEWYPRHLAPADIHAHQGPTAPPADGVGCFFSGGVDSFYSALTHLDRLTHLVFVLGFDIMDDEVLATQALDSARSAAVELGKPLIEVRTTLRSAFGDLVRVPWGWVFHGPALAHVATALSPVLGTVIVPSSYSTGCIHRWGSHPELDPLWSSSSVTLEHDSIDVTRLEKVRTISKSSTAMRNLRVCWENRDGRFNCGRCSKCLRTMLELLVAGGNCTTLPDRPRADQVKHIHAASGERFHLRQVLDELRAGSIDDPELERAIRTAIRRGPVLQYFPQRR
ncbi:hypothetical protein [Gordonia sp. N1V]|uniref:hypothetical protein n=1 Tax=Gordonia sp. N1V TaxID=3034163 RepID=UPI0023E282AE|nr:hypothetical protein [Gordonia sp. N1V]MDF3282250.1 hypothetical protein [Gordonia sp. N1V]